MLLYSFQNLFVEQLNELYSSEKQIAAALPQLMGLVSSLDLRDKVDLYIQHVKHHAELLNLCLQELKINPQSHPCKPIEGIIQEMEVAAHHGGNSPVKDAAIIAMLQRLAHYKIALYGTARTFARHLNYHAMDLLQRALIEENTMDRTLTRLAEGGIFSTGINEAAHRAKEYAEV